MTAGFRTVKVSRRSGMQKPGRCRLKRESEGKDQEKEATRVRSSAIMRERKQGGNWGPKCGVKTEFFKKKFQHEMSQVDGEKIDDLM